MMLGGMTMVVSSGVIMASTLMMDATWAAVAQKIVPWLFTIGAVAYVVMQRMQTYTGNSIAVKRLRNIQLLSGIAFIIAGLLLIENFMHIVMPHVVKDLNGYVTYMQVVHNNWVVLLLIGAVLQMYTTHRIASELNKES